MSASIKSNLWLYQKIYIMDKAVHKSQGTEVYYRWFKTALNKKGRKNVQKHQPNIHIKKRGLLNHSYSRWMCKIIHKKWWTIKDVFQSRECQRLECPLISINFNYILIYFTFVRYWGLKNNYTSKDVYSTQGIGYTGLWKISKWNSNVLIWLYFLTKITICKSINSQFTE